MLTGFNIIDTLAGRPDWVSRFCASMRTDGETGGCLMITEAPGAAADTITAPNFALITTMGTVDDLILLATVPSGVTPGPMARHMRNAGNTLGTMGKIADYLPGNVNKSIFNQLNTTPADPLALAAGTIYKLAAVTLGGNFDLPTGVAGDQIDITNEGYSATYNVNFNVRYSAVTLLNVTRTAGALPFYVTAFCEAPGDWTVVQSG